MRQSSNAHLGALIDIGVEGMRYCFLMLVLAAVAVAAMGCEQIKAKQETQTNAEPKTSEEPVTGDEPPLLLDDEPPLLLDGGEQEFLSPTGLVADNSRCHVCHLNYVREDIAVIHALANIGCADCHGQCDEHIADESWAWGENGTPPDIMYPAERINSSCKACHPTAKLGRGKKYCTDCHGDHRLAQRKCKWK